MSTCSAGDVNMSQMLTMSVAYSILYIPQLNRSQFEFTSRINIIMAS